MKFDPALIRESDYLDMDGSNVARFAALFFQDGEYVQIAFTEKYVKHSDSLMKIIRAKARMHLYEYARKRRLRFKNMVPFPPEAKAGEIITIRSQK